MKYLDVVTHPIKIMQSWLFKLNTKSANLADDQTLSTLKRSIDFKNPIRTETHAKDALATANRQGALSIACEELEILADLLEVYFIQEHAPELQKQAIKLARRLAEKLVHTNSIRDVQATIEVEFDQLSKTLLMLKNRQLVTDRGLSWTDIMRPSARTVALAIHRYQHCVQGEAQGFLDNHGRGHQRLNITYTALQRRIYLTD